MTQNSEEQSRSIGSVIRRFIIPIFIILSLVWSAAGQDILQQTAEYLITSDPPAPVDAVVVLGGYAPGRMLEAVDLYKQNYASYIVLSSEERRSDTTYAILKTLNIENLESYQFSRAVAVKLGVPEDAILVVDGQANSTRDEARKLKPFLLNKGFTSIIAVSSKTHTTRTGKIFNWIFEDRIQVRMRPTKYDEFDPAAWWEERWMARAVLLEYMKMADLYVAMLFLEQK